MSTEAALHTPVWILVGLTRNVPGVLEVIGGRLALTTEERTVFNVPLGEVRAVNFPWHYFGGGAKITVGSEKYRLSFVRPNDARDVPDHLLSKKRSPDAAAFLKGGSPRTEIGEGRQAGKAWKIAFAAARHL